MTYTAGPISFLRTLVIIIGIYYLIRLFFRYLAPRIFKWYVTRKINEFQKQPFDYQKKKEGEIHIENTQKMKKSSSIDDDLGEYVDYEEVE